LLSFNTKFFIFRICNFSITKKNITSETKNAQFWFFVLQFSQFASLKFKKKSELRSILIAFKLVALDFVVFSFLSISYGELAFFLAGVISTGNFYSTHC